MKKVSKIITLVLVVVMLCSVLTGCAMFGKNTAAYRKAVLAEIGTQTITVGALLDAFNTQYNNYYYYISNGYFTAEQVFEMAAGTLYEQAIKVDSYVASNKAQTSNKAYVNGEHLEEDELTFVVAYVKYLMFTNFDTQVESYLSQDFTFNAVEEEDTSRDFLKPDEIVGYKNYAEYVYEQNFVNEDMVEYLEENYGVTDLKVLAKDNSVESYVMGEATAAKTLSDYNARLEEDAEKQVTYADLKENQEKVYKLYAESIQKSYGITIEEFVKDQTESMIKSIIVAKYNYNLYKDIDENAQETIDALVVNSEGLKQNQQTDFILNNSYDSFITKLADTSYIYADSAEAENYIFVKNILVPFTAKQTKYLANIASTMGGTESDEYKAAREQIAAEIVADNFLGEKDAEGKLPTVSDLFKLESDKLVLNTSSEGWNNESGVAVFNADGTVAGATQEEKTANIIYMMKKFNTDTAQHSAVYDYVVRVKDDDNYTQPWVEEFVEAAKQASNALGSYAVCVSSYGVHIVYYSAQVQSQSFAKDVFAGIVNSEKIDTTSPAYKVYKSYFETQSSNILTEKTEELMDEYYELYQQGKIIETKEFKKFIKENELEYTFEQMVKPEDHEGHNH